MAKLDQPGAEHIPVKKARPFAMPKQRLILPIQP